MEKILSLFLHVGILYFAFEIMSIAASKYEPQISFWPQIDVTLQWAPLAV